MSNQQYRTLNVNGTYAIKNLKEKLDFFKQLRIPYLFIKRSNGSVTKLFLRTLADQTVVYCHRCPHCPQRGSKYMCSGCNFEDHLFEFDNKSDRLSQFKTLWSKSRTYPLNQSTFTDMTMEQHQPIEQVSVLPEESIPPKRMKLLDRKSVVDWQDFVETTCKEPHQAGLLLKWGEMKIKEFILYTVLGDRLLPTPTLLPLIQVTLAHLGNVPTLSEVMDYRDRNGLPPVSMEESDFQMDVNIVRFYVNYMFSEITGTVRTKYMLIRMMMLHFGLLLRYSFRFGKEEMEQQLKDLAAVPNAIPTIIFHSGTNEILSIQGEYPNPKMTVDSVRQLNLRWAELQQEPSMKAFVDEFRHQFTFIQ